MGWMGIMGYDKRMKKVGEKGVAVEHDPREGLARTLASSFARFHSYSCFVNPLALVVTERKTKKSQNG